MLPETATIEVRGAAYDAARERPRKDETAVRAAIRIARGGEKPPPNPIVLIDAAARPLARALEDGGGFAIGAGGHTFELRRRSPFSRRYDLSRTRDGTRLGTVGQKSLFSTHLTSDLPSEVPEWLQAFLFVLLYDKTFVELDLLGGAGG